jgi:hypothetical protein
LIENERKSTLAGENKAGALDSRSLRIKYRVLGKDLVDGFAPAHRVVFTEDIVKIASQ